ncbi:hypothetical protein CLOM_g13960 [Closterium sp. NIES-68]|nr:hypothetical protein CLOM_g13960 [Closterium sp. NIES-68]
MPSTDKVQPTDFQVSLRGDTNSKVSAFNFWSRGPDTLYAEGSLYGFPYATAAFTNACVALDLEGGKRRGLRARGVLCVPREERVRKKCCGSINGDRERTTHWEHRKAQSFSATATAHKWSRRSLPA